MIRIKRNHPTIVWHALKVLITQANATTVTVFPNRARRCARLVSGLFSIFLPDGLLPFRVKPKLHATSWLDGVRGVASFIVFLHHTTLAYPTGVRYGYGSAPGATNPASLPIIRVWLSGGAMVSVFFVVSGYSLSTKALGLARQRRYDELYRSVASSTFRRGPRLYIPMLGITLISAIMAQLHLFHSGYNRPVAANMFIQIKDWLLYSIGFMNPFTGRHDHNKYEIVCWSLPVEFLGSLLVFACTLALAQSSTAFRSIALMTMMLSWMYIGAVEQMLFTAGMVCADIHYYHTPVKSHPPLQPSPPDRDNAPASKPRCTLRRNFDFMAVFFVVLWLITMPEPAEYGAITPGYRTLSRYTPLIYRAAVNHSMFFPCIGAVSLVALIDLAGEGSWLQWMFNTRVAQWLGKISFSLYLCHMMIHFTLESRLLLLFAGWWHVSPYTGYVVVLATLCCLPPLFLLSEVLTAVLDKGSIRIARAMYRL